MVSFLSVYSAAQQSVALFRKGTSREILLWLRHWLGNLRTRKAGWVAPFVWQVPMMLLNISLVLFLLGLFIGIWCLAAVTPGWDDDTKVY